MSDLLLLLRRRFKVPRIRYTQTLLRHYSSIPSKDFFLENNITNDINTPTPDNQFKEYFSNRSKFVNPCSYFNKYNASKKPFENMDTPPDHFQSIIDRNENSIPKEGSIVEVTSLNNMKPKLGIVVRQALSRFDERYNKLLVLTSDNELIDVSAFNVNFHLYRVLLPQGSINFHEIVNNRYDEDDTNRIQAVEFIRSFVDDALELKQELHTKLDRVYSQFTGDTMNSITLIDIIDAIKFKETTVIKIGNSFYNQCVLLLAIHWSLVDSPKWIVPNYLSNNKVSNVLTGHSNNFHSTSEYFVTPSPIWMSISKFIEQVELVESRDDMESFLDELKQLPVDKLSSFLEVYEGRHMAYILDVLKFALVYPHELIMESLKKLSVFSDELSSRKIYNFLVDIHVLNDSNDILSSSGLISGSGDNDLWSNLQAEGYSTDFFKHLRSKKTYYQDHVIYGLPIDGDKSSSRLAISLENINARKDVVNIHIPDITTIIPPNSSVMENIFDNLSTHSSSLTKLMGGKTIGDLFPANLVESRKFQKYETETTDNLWDDGLETKKRRPISKATCMTISFQFNFHEGDPFKSFKDKVYVSFDSISDLNVKILDTETIEKCLSGQLESPIFRLLRRTQSPNSSGKVQLNKADIHNINYINGIMKSFFKSREHSGAANISPNQEIVPTDASALTIEESANSQSWIVRDTPVPSPKFDFFIRELQLFAGALVGEYCSQYSIPIINENQTIEPTIYDMDKVVVTHDNLLIPPYESENYHHSVIAKDQHGYISLPGNLVSKNYLSPKTKTTTAQQNLPMGLKKGFVNVVDVFTKGEAILNQYQLLFYQHELLARKLSMDCGFLSTMQKFIDLKQHGYELQGPLTESQIESQMRVIRKGSTKANYVGRFNKKYWTLRWLEQVKLKLDVIGESRLFRCIVTRVGETINAGTICQCYCVDFGIEIEVLTEKHEIHIGSKLTCDGIIEVDSINGVCLLKDENYGTSLYL
ncbi:conserved hypothetical protein [Candida tropicalis MYA-3404]|uniref:Uncharacterized protein n=1 Tax=Candida tropicalis (strain ATCC MYA-3404 / T1) TaxID=294747 RepID=C5M4E0_CANTT|nr:conserved hypothetical protein [Candida tropicalis MYA-3404]EER36190.1 conserved hypothetical protein [Candida tropicalis MYA-3404]KAG4410311.1 hypothetical protein JTP64_000949 [Candida tropicalis]